MPIVIIFALNFIYITDEALIPWGRGGGYTYIMRLSRAYYH